MAANFVLLEKIVVGAAGASSVTFSSIPQTGYTDLVLKGSVRSNASGNNDAVVFGLNGNAFTSSMTNRVLRGDGSTAISAAGSYSIAGYISAGGSTASTFGTVEVYFPNYAGSNYKSMSADGVSENNGTTAWSQLSANLWSSTAAITSITLSTGGGGNFVANSTFYLYGVAKLGTTPAIQPYATGGDTIMTDGTYWYHAFKSSGTFTPAKGLTCDVLVVAGGGGGGSSGQYYAAGGAGAGGVLAFASEIVSTATTITVGAGGAGGTVSAGLNGSNSQFASLTASVGGGSGANIAVGFGAVGGSGGAGANVSIAGTAGQGNASGTPGTTTGGGGGGAGAVGGNGVTPNGGSGGAGVSTYTNWGSLTAALNTTGTGINGFIAGGGGGGGSPYYGTVTQASGGSGGGGNGGTISSTGVGNGVANTGGGGGGAAGTNATAPPQGVGGNGGSGLVIVRYLR